MNISWSCVIENWTTLFLSEAFLTTTLKISICHGRQHVHFSLLLKSIWLQTCSMCAIYSSRVYASDIQMLIFFGKIFLQLTQLNSAEGFNEKGIKICQDQKSNRIRQRKIGWNMHGKKECLKLFKEIYFIQTPIFHSDSNFSWFPNI